jgi:ribosomal protein S18 acetylase RimI-like enzyme
MHEPATPPAWHIRQTTSKDIPALAEMVNAAYAIEDFLEGVRTTPEQLAAEMQKGRILILTDARNAPLASVFCEERGDHGYLGMLAVSPRAQGLGLARRLVRAAEELFRQAGLSAIEISVLSLRRELLPIYRRFGFTETGIEAFHFSRRFKSPDAAAACHCILMRKPLL